MIFLVNTDYPQQFLAIKDYQVPNILLVFYSLYCALSSIFLSLYMHWPGTDMPLFIYTSLISIMVL